MNIKSERRCMSKDNVIKYIDSELENKSPILSEKDRNYLAAIKEYYVCGNMKNAAELFKVNEKTLYRRKRQLEELLNEGKTYSDRKIFNNKLSISQRYSIEQRLRKSSPIRCNSHGTIWTKEILSAYIMKKYNIQLSYSECVKLIRHYQEVKSEIIEYMKLMKAIQNKNYNVWYVELPIVYEILIKTLFKQWKEPGAVFAYNSKTRGRKVTAFSCIHEGSYKNLLIKMIADISTNNQRNIIVLPPHKFNKTILEELASSDRGLPYTSVIIRPETTEGCTEQHDIIMKLREDWEVDHKGKPLSYSPNHVGYIRERLLNS